MREVSLPPTIISIQDNPIPLSAIVEEIKTLAVKLVELLSYFNI